MAMTEKHYHAVQFYKDDESLTATVAEFLAEGINTGQPGLVIATPAHSERIAHGLTMRGIDVALLKAAGELQFFDAHTLLSSFMRDGSPDQGLFRSNVEQIIRQLCGERPPCPIRAYGEMVDVLWQDGNADGAIKLEILWNQLAAAFDFSLLCGYAVGHFYKETRDPRYQAVCDQHSHVADGSSAAL